jgi:hypothetical protein
MFINQYTLREYHELLTQILLLLLFPGAKLPS